MKQTNDGIFSNKAGENFNLANVFLNVSPTLQKQPSKGVLGKRCSKNMQQFTGEHPRGSAISIKLQTNFIKITLWHRCFSVNLLHIFKTALYRNIYGGMLLIILATTKKQK